MTASGEIAPVGTKCNRRLGLSEQAGPENWRWAAEMRTSGSQSKPVLFPAERRNRWPMMRSLLALVFAALTLSTAKAQELPDGSVSDHYRAYRAAFDRGDIVGAEAPARAALMVSQARDGEGGRTGVLA